MKEKIANWIETQRDVLVAMADDIFDHPEACLEEFRSSALVADYLEAQGFSVERGLGSLPTAFRASYKSGNGGTRIGLLCEYDAMPNGHSCGHHMQGPAIIGAAAALKAVLPGDYEVVVYGTPAEENGVGKLTMLKEGYLKDIDVAFMMHANPATQVDVRSMANVGALVTFHGKSAHAALKPDAGISALDALLLAFHGIETMREHVKEDTRMHYVVKNGGSKANMVPDTASGEFMLRSYSSTYLDYLVERFEKIIQGAALMTETTYDIEYDHRNEAKVPVLKLNDLVMEQAEYYNAPNIKPPRLKTGSTDFANVMFFVPGTCIRIAFVEPGCTSHSQEYLDAGKTQMAHDAVICSAKILAAAAYELIDKPELMKAIQDEFAANKAKS